MGMNEGDMTVKFAMGNKWQEVDMKCPECLEKGKQVNMLMDKLDIPTIYMCPKCRYVLAEKENNQ